MIERAEREKSVQTSRKTYTSMKNVTRQTADAGVRRQSGRFYDVCAGLGLIPVPW
jgi:hypothetical protein